MQKPKSLARSLRARRELSLEILEKRWAMHAGTVDIFVDFEIAHSGMPDINGSSQLGATVTLLNAGDVSQQNVVDEFAAGFGDITGFIELGAPIEGSFEADENPPTISFSSLAPPLLQMHVQHTGTFEATVNGSPVTGTFVATIDATLDFDLATASGTIELVLTDSDGVEDSQTIQLENGTLIVTPSDFQLPDATLGSVSDRIWYDDNNNGIFDTTEVGAAFIEAVLVDTVNGIAGDLDDVPLASTSSDQEGYYSFINVPAGDYYVEFLLLDDQQFTEANVGSDDDLDSDVDPLADRTAVLSIGAGTHLQNIDAGIRSLIAIWQNPVNRFDVSDSGGVTPFDVGLILRELTINGIRRFDPILDPLPPPYFDVTGDHRLTPQDVLQVLNVIILGTGEGEMPLPAHQAFADEDLRWI